MKAIKDCIELAPLHNPPNIVGIEACQNIMPNTPMIAVFDTAFHQTIPKYAYLYALPYDIYEKYGVRKYGFHGTSHKYVSQRAAIMLNRPIEELNLISCHLGNGASVCAIKGGRSVETSMGFTPLAGLAMGTRSGTIDPAVIEYLMSKKKMTISEVNDYLNRKSGVLGISGVSSDFRDIEVAADDGNERAALAIDIFCYRVKKYIGEYSAVMGGLDAVIFTAGIGENNNLVRKKVLTGLEYAGIEIDWEKNLIRGKEMDISTKDAKIRTLVIPTNEELSIARETLKLIEK
jgi:acetate kinase